LIFLPLTTSSLGEQKFTYSYEISSLAVASFSSNIIAATLLSFLQFFVIIIAIIVIKFNLTVISVTYFLGYRLKIYLHFSQNFT